MAMYTCMGDRNTQLSVFVSHQQSDCSFLYYGVHPGNEQRKQFCPINGLASTVTLLTAAATCDPYSYLPPYPHVHNKKKLIKCSSQEICRPLAS